MIAAHAAVQRPSDAKLLVVDSQRNLVHVPRSSSAVRLSSFYVRTM
jgi:hypothetical protein